MLPEEADGGSSPAVDLRDSGHSLVPATPSVAGAAGEAMAAKALLVPTLLGRSRRAVVALTAGEEAGAALDGVHVLLLVRDDVA